MNAWITAPQINKACQNKGRVKIRFWFWFQKPYANIISFVHYLCSQRDLFHHAFNLEAFRTKPPCCAGCRWSTRNEKYQIYSCYSVNLCTSIVSNMISYLIRLCLRNWVCVVVLYLAFHLDIGQFQSSTFGGQGRWVKEKWHLFKKVEVTICIWWLANVICLSFERYNLLTFLFLYILGLGKLYI